MGSQLPEWIDSGWIRKLRANCLAWYSTHQRALPWRETHDGYAIWVSEIMLQQTQVATVIPYFHRFLERFPDARTLASASEEEVFRYWEGLGYYRRAKQMHAAAKKIVESHQGCFPSSFDDILSLPGIGRYTAGAVASFAYDQARPILEANTRRLYARLCLLKDDLNSSESQSLLWQFAERVLPRKGSGQLNQALMEIGSQVCKPRSPDCGRCPLQDLCPTRARGLQQEIPSPSRKKNYEERTEVVLLLQDRHRQWLLRKCQSTERWAGLWDFPRFDITNVPSSSIESKIHSQCKEKFGRGCKLGTHVHTLKHGVTRYRITLHCYKAQWAGRGSLQTQQALMDWATTDDLDRFALNRTARTIANLVRKSKW